MTARNVSRIRRFDPPVPTFLGLGSRGLRLGSGKDAGHVLPAPTISTISITISLALVDWSGHPWLPVVTRVVTRYIIEDGQWRGAAPPSDDQVGLLFRRLVIWQRFPATPTICFPNSIYPVVNGGSDKRSDLAIHMYSYSHIFPMK